MSRKALAVTDHALIRYLERVCGIDAERIRKRIWLQAREAPENGRRTVNGITFIRKNGAVVTVTTTAQPEPEALTFDG